MDIPHTSLCVSGVCKLQKIKSFFKNNLKASHFKQQHYQRVLLISLVANCFQYKANGFNPSNLKEFEHGRVTLDGCSRLGNSYRFISFSPQSAAAITAY